MMAYRSLRSAPSAQAAPARSCKACTASRAAREYATLAAWRASPVSAIGFAKAADTFKAMNCEVLGLSIDGLFAHLARTRNIQEKFGVKIPFPIIEDIKMDAAHANSVVHPGAADTQAVRATFFIDPNGVRNGALPDEQRPLDQRVRAPGAGHADQRQERRGHARRPDALLRRDRAAAQDRRRGRQACQRRLQDDLLALLDQVAVDLAADVLGTSTAAVSCGPMHMQPRALLIESIRSGTVASLVIVPHNPLFEATGLRIRHYGPKYTALFFDHPQHWLLFAQHLVIGWVASTTPRCLRCGPPSRCTAARMALASTGRCTCGRCSV
jgi:hypothetical protein